jgi:hypothetical protein
MDDLAEDLVIESLDYRALLLYPWVRPSRCRARLPSKWVVAARAEGHSNLGGAIRQHPADSRRENEQRRRPGSRRQDW